MKISITFQRRPLVAALALFLVASPLSAYAHAELVETVPAQEEAIAVAPEELRLTFSEGVELAFTKVTIAGEDETEIATGDLSLTPEDNKTVIVPIEGELTSGTYTVDWSVVSADGHKIEGSYSMEIAQ